MHVFTEQERRRMSENLDEVVEFQQDEHTRNLTLIAHRGMGPTSLLGSTFERTFKPENTLEAFKEAFLSGADGIELDIFKSKDNQIMVIHDNELWRNVYGDDRTGNELPSRETKETYQIGNKTREELQRLSVGPGGEKIPTLQEVFDLAKAANAIRKEKGLKPLIINVELKDASANNECLDLIQEYMHNNPDSGIDFTSICFCSFHHECLKQLKIEATRRHIGDVIQIAPGIKTTTLFGQDNVNPDFSLKPGATYQQEGLNQLKALVEDNGFTAYDGILWDLYNPLVDLAKTGGKQIHASTSDFRQYEQDESFSEFLYSMSQQVPVYFKCDEVTKARKLLIARAQARKELLEDQVLRLGPQEALRRDGEHSEQSISRHLDKPQPFSKILKELRRMETYLRQEPISRHEIATPENTEKLINAYLTKLLRDGTSSECKEGLENLIKVKLNVPDKYITAYIRKLGAITATGMQEGIESLVKLKQKIPDEALEFYVKELIKLGPSFTTPKIEEVIKLGQKLPDAAVEAYVVELLRHGPSYTQPAIESLIKLGQKIPPASLELYVTDLLSHGVSFTTTRIESLIKLGQKLPDAAVEAYVAELVRHGPSYTQPAIESLIKLGQKIPPASLELYVADLLRHGVSFTTTRIESLIELGQKLPDAAVESYLAELAKHGNSYVTPAVQMLEKSGHVIPEQYVPHPEPLLRQFLGHQDSPPPVRIVVDPDRGNKPHI